MKVAIYPGTFDPITNGHLDIITRSIKFVDKLIIAVSNNNKKKTMFSINERVQMIKKVIQDIKVAKQKGFRCNVNCTLFHQMTPKRTAKFFDFVTDLGVDGITVSPGYAYERAADQENFLKRKKTKNFFRDIFKLGKGKKWAFSQSSLFLDFLEYFEWC